MAPVASPPPQINLIAPPQYVMTTTTLDKPEGIAALNASIQIIKDSIEEQDGGHFNVKVEVGCCWWCCGAGRVFCGDLRCHSHTCMTA